MPSSKRLTFAAFILLAAFLGSPCHAATLAHRYSFDVDASDSVGGNDGILIDDASVSGGELILDGAPNGPSGDSMGFTSTMGIGSNFGSSGVTFEAWYTDQGSGSWAKLFSFGNGTSGSNIIFNLQQGGSGQGRIQYQGMAEANFGPRPTLGTEHHLALTISQSGEVNAWIDGVQIQASPPNLSGDGNNLSILPSSWERIGASAWGDANMSGSINEFRIWDGVLSVAEVAESHATGPDDLPGNGPRIESFIATPAARLEGETVTLSWSIDVSKVTGSLSLEVRDSTNMVVHSSTNASGSTAVTMGDTGGIPQQLTYTLLVWDTDNPGSVRTGTTEIAVDPGIPSAGDQVLQTVTTTPVTIILTGADPNSHPGPLGFVVRSGPGNGTLDGTPPHLTYTAGVGFTGTDSFTFRTSDGKYESPDATVRIEVEALATAPTGIAASTQEIGENVLGGGLVAILQVSDPNPAETHTFALVPGEGSTDNALFGMVGNQLRAVDGFVGQLGNSFSIRVRATDPGGLFLEEILPFTVVEVSNDVVINEIHFNPPDNTVRQEFVELYNPAGSDADLTGWRFSGAINYSFPAGTVIPADGYLVIAEDPVTLGTTLGASALGPYAGQLDSEGETIRLRDQNDVVVDLADYRVGFPWPVLADGLGASIELINPALDNSLGSSWRASVPQSGKPELVYVPLNSTGWSWRSGATEASDPVDSWRQQVFVEDASWTPGVQLPLGYGRVGNVTLNTTINGMQNSYTHLFLRKTFTIAPGEVPSQLSIRTTSDDGFVMWINGVEVERRRFNGAPLVGQTANNQGNEGAYETKSVLNAAAFLVEGTNTMAVQLINGTLGSSDIGLDVEVKRPSATGGIATPSPGARNTAFAVNAAPNIRKVRHAPDQPTSVDPIVVTALITDPEGVGSVTLEYQVVAPGAYVPSHLPLPVSGGNINLSVSRPENPAYDRRWIPLAMVDDGSGNDALGGDDIFTVTLPVQTHRSLVRYRITVEDDLGLSERVPYPDDEARNFACFVYDGVPSYNRHPAATLETLPVYHVITRAEDYAECLAYGGGDQISQGTEARFFYNWTCAIVCDGKVYDNIRYRLRGANGRYHAAGKRSMRFRFNQGGYFQARDQFGREYDKKWRTLTTGKGFDNRSTLTHALNEAVSMYLFNRIGVPAPDTHWVHWRVIDDSSEAPDRWRGDFHGLNFVLETYDVRFMEAHGMEKGNLYKLINQTGDWQRQQRYQAAFAPDDGSDHDNIENNLDGGDPERYITAHVNMEKWNLWHAMVEAIRHYDYWPSANKNMVYYFEPDYLAVNNNRGKLWILPWDTDASWGPTWNSGHDAVYNALFNAGGGGSDNNTTPSLWPEYFNVVRELRDLLWQPDQIEPLVEEFASFIAEFEAADADRWKGAPSDAGNYGGLGGAGAGSLASLVQDMKNFAFNGGNWPGGGVGAGGRASHLDSLQASQGEGGQIPNTPRITYAGAPGFPTNGLTFRSSRFSDPQGTGTFGAMEWRLAGITDPAAPGHDPTERFKLEWEADWESGELPSYTASFAIPTVAVRSGRTYRARVRHRDSSGRWSHWSLPLEFTTTLPDISDYLNGLVISEFMYHPAGPDPAELAAGFDDEDFFEFIELYNAGAVTLDLTDLRFTKGIDFDFSGAGITTLAPGEFVLVVANRAAFEMRYGNGLPVAGVWEDGDRLDNGGERLKLSFGAGDGIRDFIFDDETPWADAADGAGPSLVLVDPDSTPDHSLPVNWRASVAVQGTPGTLESGSAFQSWLATQGASDPLALYGTTSISNLLAYALGADLVTEGSNFLPSLSIVEEGGLSYAALSYRVRRGASEIGYTVETSEDLVSWETGGGFTGQIGVPVDNGDGTETVTVRTLIDLTASPRRFLRLRVGLGG